MILKKKKKDLCPLGIYILEHMQINMLKFMLKMVRAIKKSQIEQGAEGTVSD